MAVPMELLRDINMELHNVVFSNQASLNRLQPLPAFMPLPSALPSGFLGQDTGTDIWRSVFVSGVLGFQIHIASGILNLCNTMC